ncbi:hypothetical protein SAMN05421823_110229 [Catalinimonas alkaloidigena]|uniref:DUF7033 domain-containing protein n=1 Tax=Catalinimonas alkaloidigena TaxID=1075417 RepID=A0A1G9QN20_9BACT|nr:polysaccharide deacetylase family protein [Catalinimonas alkaloidigena]SDM12221.1 hypothetical protein SAMN05421823_110229 [Catalinimonas alkaloidigena]
MLYVYIPDRTPRHEYIVHLLLEELLGIPVEYVTEPAELQAKEGPKLVYARAYQGPAFFLKAVPLLWEKDIRPQAIETVAWEGAVPGIFPVDGGRWAFDPLAASFWLVSRYEEYLPFVPDAHGRFPAEASWMVQQQLQLHPLVNHWVRRLLTDLRTHFGTELGKMPTYTFRTTLDIDNAFAFQHKGFYRAGVGTLAAMGRRDFRMLGARFNVALQKTHDPYDTHQKLRRLHEKYHTKPFVFWLLGDYGPFDKNLSHKNPALQSLIRQSALHADLGIHPSYASLSKAALIVKEKKRLEQIVHQPIIRSRQHYLRMQLPRTYRDLLAAGIRGDYTMGWATTSGFRAGLAAPFLFYDLAKEETTKLRVFPFAFMDATLLKMKLTPDAAVAHVGEIVDAVKQTGGWLSGIFHNESPGGWGEWEGWGDVYEAILQKAVS